LARNADRCSNVLSENQNEQKVTFQTTLSSYCKIQTKYMARQDSEKLLKARVSMRVDDFRPFAIFEGRGFLEVAQTLVDLKA